MLRLLRLVGAGLALVAYYAGVRREVTESNLKLALPELSEGERRRIARRSFSNLGQVFLEFLYLRYADRSQVANGLAINNLDLYSKAVSSTDGAILLSGHLGNWEWLAMGCGLQIQAPLDVIIKNQRSGVAENFLLRMRTRFGNKMLNAGDVRGIFRALASGELLAILGDQSAPPESVRVPFFGFDVPTFEGTARMALRTRVPILFLQPLKRTPQGYECTFHQVAFDDLTEPSEENVRVLTARHTALLEKVIRECPELWLWQHKRWKHAVS